MSKIAEKKALEAYPTPLDNEPFISKGFVEEKNRKGFIKGYDQAMQDMVKDSERLQYLSDEMGYAYACGCKKTMQDFLEKAEKWLKDNSKKYVVCYEDGYSHYAYNSMIEDFKNYMQDESEEKEEK